MAFLNYEYRMKIDYTELVNKCYFTMKSIPTDDFRQRSISYEISMSPPAKYSESQDSFGNLQIIGSEDKTRSEFEYSIKGMVETRSGNIIGGIQPGTVGMYKYPHGKCIPGESLKQFVNEIGTEVASCTSDKDKCIRIMDLLFKRMIYEPGSTSVNTSAEEAFRKGSGVCQDYSHIYITLLRMFGIPARYVCGLIVGEGESHSWVEAVCNRSFIAFDPTHNIEITDEYIKLGVGRDAFDCAINKGVMWGGGSQTQKISVTVEKYY